MDPGAARACVGRVDRRVTLQNGFLLVYRAMAGGDVRGRVTGGSDSPMAVGWSDRARAMTFKTVSDWLRLRQQIWVALATANCQARERASDERRRKAERGDVGTPHSRGVSGTILGVSVNELGSTS